MTGLNFVNVKKIEDGDSKNARFWKNLDRGCCYKHEFY